MKILDAGSKVLDDHDVLLYIRSKQAQHKSYDAGSKAQNRPKTKRPANFLRALQKHEEHLTHAERPFSNNAKYDDESAFLVALMQALEPRAQLTKTELLMLANHRPHLREFLLPMVEDVDARFDEETQQFIVDTVVEVLGRPNMAAAAQEAQEARDGEAMET